MGKNVRGGGVYVEIFTKDGRFVKGLRNAGKKMKAFGGGIAKAGAGVAAAGVAMLAPFGLALKVFKQYGDQLDKMSARTGLSVAALSQLTFAMEQGGGTAEELEKALTGMSRFLLTLSQGSSTATDVMDRLGVSMADLAGLNAEQKFELLAEKIAGIEDPTERAGVALALFGKAGAKMLPMIENMAELRAEADRLGLTMDEETTTAAAAFADALNKLSRIFKATMTRIGAAIAGPLTAMIELWADNGKAIADFLKDNKALIQIVAAVGVGIVVLGGALMTAGFAVMGLGAAFGVAASVMTFFGGVLAALFSPFVLVAVAIGGVIAAIVSMTDITSSATTAVSSAWATGTAAVRGFFGELGESIGLAVQLLQNGNISGAAKVLWAGLKITWLKGIAAITQPWLEWKKAFLETAFSAWYGLQSFLSTAWSAMQTGWNAFSFALVDTFDAVTSNMAQGFMWFVSKVMGGIASVLRFIGMTDTANALQSTADSWAESQKAEADARAGRQKQRLDEAARKQNEIDAEAAAGLQRISDARDAAMDGLEIDNSAITAAEEEYAAARGEFAAATQAARDELGASKADDEKKDVEKAAAAGAGAFDAKGAAAAGTFSAATAARGGLFGGPVEKMADGITTLVKTAKQQLKETKKATAETFG